MSVGATGYDQRMLREARMGLMIIVALFVTLTYFGYQYLRSRGDQIPDYVWQAPLAVEIDPDDVLQMTRRRLGHAPVDERPETMLGERFADQRSAFQPTQPMPRETVESNSTSTSQPDRQSGPSSSPRLFPPPSERVTETGGQKFQPALHPPVKTEIPQSQTTTAEPSLTTTKEPPLPTVAAPTTEISSAAKSSATTTSPLTSAEGPPSGQPIGLTVLPNTKTIPSSNDFQPLLDSKPSSVDSPPSQPKNSDFQPAIQPKTPPEVSPKPVRESSAFKPLGEFKPQETSSAKRTPPPVAPSVTPPEWPKSIELKSHDSLWDAARTIYGDGQWFRALYQHNLSRLEGMTDRQQTITLECPAPLELANRFPDLAPPDFLERDETRVTDPTKYQTVAGDSLFEIARQQLGQASRYLELMELNRDRLPPAVNHLTRLPAGIDLQLPQK